jgi:F420-dependent oxidoreductase-like protein
MIGVFLPAAGVRDTVDRIKLAESMGIPSVWLVSGSPGADSLTICAVAAVETQRVKMGISVAQIWARHPLTLANEAYGIDSLAPGRFRLGMGSGHRPSMTHTFGADFTRPLARVREYLKVIRTLFRTGSVDFEGEFVTARQTVPKPVDIPVMASALQVGSYETCGELADGAISWVSPWPYLRDVALPAMQASAAKAGRQTPPLIAHVPICISSNRDEIREAATEHLIRYTQLPFYQRMFAAAGLGDVSGGVSEAMIDAIVATGNEESVAARLRQIKAEGAGEVIAFPFPAGADKATSLTRALEAIAAAQ